MSGGDEKRSTRTVELDAGELARALRDASSGDVTDASDPAASVGTAPPPVSEAEWSEAFGEPERPSIEKIEACLAAGQAREAILQCVSLVDSVLAIDGQDQALSALLVGVAGPQWIRFQHAVRTARAGQPVSRELAVECFAFVLATSARCNDVLARAKPGSGI